MVNIMKIVDLNKFRGPICITSYNGDHLARFCEIMEVRPKTNTVLVKCLVRSSPSHTIYRQYKVDKIDGIAEVKVEV